MNESLEHKGKKYHLVGTDSTNCTGCAFLDNRGKCGRWASNKDQYKFFKDIDCRLNETFVFKEIITPGLKKKLEL